MILIAGSENAAALFTCRSKAYALCFGARGLLLRQSVQSRLLLMLMNFNRIA